jgi:hypothetical protein
VQIATDSSPLCGLPTFPREIRYVSCLEATEIFRGRLHRLDSGVSFGQGRFVGPPVLHGASATPDEPPNGCSAPHVREQRRAKVRACHGLTSNVRTPDVDNPQPFAAALTGNIE